MKRIITLAAFFTLALTSCSTEDAVTETNVDVHRLAEGLKAGAMKAWEGYEAPNFFKYSNAEELQVQSDKRFTFLINDVRSELKNYPEGTKVIYDVEVVNGMAKPVHCILIDKDNKFFESISPSIITKSTEMPTYEERFRQYKVLTYEADKNVEVIGHYLLQNLISDADKVIVELHINMDEAFVCAAKI